MKEAAGEANMTVLTIVLIGIVLAAGSVIIKGLMDNIQKRSENLDENVQTSAVVTDTYNCI